MTAAPVVTQPLNTIGAPGKTDFVKIYIASELNKDEYRTTLRHEQAHVWARHGYRKPKDAYIHQWMVACEMEIARNIYDDKDISVIKFPRSRLKGGFLPDSIPNLPDDLLLAEDIYQWLIDNPQDNPANKTCACVYTESDNIVEVHDNIPHISEIRDEIDKKEALEESRLASLSSYKAALYRPPTLVDSIDSILRVRVIRERTYRRPSRRDVPDVILRGRVSTPRPPLVEIFIDRSGSFNAAKTEDAENRMVDILRRYGASIHSDVFYFGNGKLVQEDPGGGGDTPYHLIAEHLKLSSPRIAIVITDDDPCTKLDRPSNTEVFCVPIGCDHTEFSKYIGGKDVIK